MFWTALPIAARMLSCTDIAHKPFNDTTTT